MSSFGMLLFLTTLQHVYDFENAFQRLMEMEIEGLSIVSYKL
jgi:hypothetical protein